MAEQNATRHAASSALREIAEHIVRHMEGVPDGLPAMTHRQRLVTIEVINDILVTSLTAEGFVRIEHPTGYPLAFRREK